METKNIIGCFCIKITFIFLGCFNYSTAQTVENAGGNIIINGAANFIVNNTHFDNNGNCYFDNTSNFHVIGSLPIIVKGSNAVTFGNIAINNSGNATLENDININTQISFLNGDLITTAANIITINTTGSATGASDNSHVDGPCTKVGNSTFVFPIGDGNYYRELEVKELSTSETFVAEYIHNDPNDDDYSRSSKEAEIIDIDHSEYWMVARTGTANAKVKVTWDEQTTSGINDYTKLVVVHWNGTQWENVGGDDHTGDNSNGSVTSDLVSSFSPYGIGTISGDNPLPIQLISFTAKCENNSNKLEWTTSTELNNDVFILERSENGIDFESIKTIQGAGNSSIVRNYSVYDNSPYNATYYRLKQIDYNGNTSTYKTIIVLCEKQAIEPPTISFNPLSDCLKISTTNSLNNNIQIVLLDQLGKITKEVSTSEGSYTLSTNHLSHGVYYLNIIISNEVFNSKVIIH